MTLAYLGVDPGATGALAVVLYNGELWWVEDMPLPIHGAAIKNLLLNEGPFTAAVEDVHVRSAQQGQTKFIEGKGIVLGALGALLIPYQLVAPNRWKKAQGVSADKDTSRLRAIEMWPAQADKFKRKKDNGRAEAALIAHWLCMENEGRRVA